MASIKKYHVTKANGGWDIKCEGANRVSAHCETKLEAIQLGRVLAKQGDAGQLIIHKQDGQIEKEYTYGRDPFPPRG